MHLNENDEELEEERDGEVNKAPANGDNIVFLDVTSTDNNVFVPNETYNNNNSKKLKKTTINRLLISELRPVEIDSQKNKRIKDIVTSFSSVGSRDEERETSSNTQEASIEAATHETTNRRISPIHMESESCHSIIIKYEQIEDGIKIPCITEQYNEFKYMYSLKKGNTDFKFFQKFSFIKFKSSTVAIKPLNGQITEDWITETKLSAIEQTLSKMLR